MNALTPELAKDVDEYFPTFFSPDHWQKMRQLRTIPVGVSISAEHQVVVYERAEEVARGKDTLAVSNCICRRSGAFGGKGATNPRRVA